MGKSKDKKKNKKQLKQFRYSLKALLSVNPADYGRSEDKQKRLDVFAKHVLSNPSVGDNSKFYRRHVITSDVKITRKGGKLEIPYTKSELRKNSQQWLTYTIGSLIRRGIIKQANTFERIS